MNLNFKTEDLDSEQTEEFEVTKSMSEAVASKVRGKINYIDRVGDASFVACVSKENEFPQENVVLEISNTFCKNVVLTEGLLSSNENKGLKGLCRNSEFIAYLEEDEK